MTSSSDLDLDGQARRPDLRRVARDIRPHWRPLLLGSIAAIVMAVAASAGPLLIGWVVDKGVIGRDLRLVWVGSLAFAFASVVSLLAMRLQVRAMGRFANVYLRDLRDDLLVHLYRLDTEFFARNPSGRVVSRLTSDVDNLLQFVENGLGLFTRVMLMVAASVTVMLVTSPLLTLVVLVVLSPLTILTFWFRRAAYEAQVEVRDRMSEVLGHVNESLIGMRVIQAYTHEDHRESAFDDVNRSTYAAKVRTARLNGTVYGVVELLNPVAIAAVIAIGAAMVADGRASVGLVIAFLLYVGRLFEPIQQISELAHVFQQASASYAKVFQFLDLCPQVADRPDAIDFIPGDGVIEFRGVSFGYRESGPLVLEDLSLTIEAGTRVAIVGSSGAGKSTVAKLVARFHDVTSGDLLVDGQRPRDVTGASLRRHVVLVPQDGYLFTGTVESNIAMGRASATRSEVEQTCRQLGILDRLAALPNGLDTRVTNRGQSLSSGERQLVALARALIAGPTVVILDEATSNLDPATDAMIERAMTFLLEGRTALIIAHRVETAVRADRVVMLSAGRVVEDGPPEDLLENAQVFSGWVTDVRSATDVD